MTLSDLSSQRIGEFIACDPEGWPYRSGLKLVAFFNKMASGKYPITEGSVEAGWGQCLRGTGWIHRNFRFPVLDLW